MYVHSLWLAGLAMPKVGGAKQRVAYASMADDQDLIMFHSCLIAHIYTTTSGDFFFIFYLNMTHFNWALILKIKIWK